MREQLAARLPARFAAMRGLEPLPPAARYILRGGATVRTAAVAAVGMELPTQSCRAMSQGGRAGLWLGPDEWLLIGAEQDGTALAGSLEKALGGIPHSLVDVSHRQVGCELRCPEALVLLAAGCPLDLDERAFPVAMCTRTVLGKAEVVLWRSSAATFRLEVARSFVAYVSQFLAEAARASGID